MVIKIKLKGSFNNTERFFNGAGNLTAKIRSILHRYGRLGVEALQNATPKDTEETANSWLYTVTDAGIFWTNSKKISSGVPLAILLQYGHGTRGGGYVQGIDYINPALEPVFNQIADACWQEVQNL